MASSSEGVAPGGLKDGRFDVADLKSREPIGQFQHWFAQAEKAHGTYYATTMTIATATKEGVPSARNVSMKKIDKSGILFFSCYGGRKAQEMTENPYCSLVFSWSGLNRAVRVEGTVERAPEESEAIFSKLPRGLQVMMHTGTQSTVIPDRKGLIQRQKDIMAKYPDERKPLPKPDHWGCFRVIPTSFEFWCMHSDFLCDRLRFRRPRKGEVVDKKLTTEMDDGWLLERLAQ